MPLPNARLIRIDGKGEGRGLTMLRLRVSNNPSSASSRNASCRFMFIQLFGKPSPVPPTRIAKYAKLMLLMLMFITLALQFEHSRGPEITLGRSEGWNVSARNCWLFVRGHLRQRQPALEKSPELPTLCYPKWTGKQTSHVIRIPWMGMTAGWTLTKYAATSNTGERIQPSWRDDTHHETWQNTPRESTAVQSKRLLCTYIRRDTSPPIIIHPGRDGSNKRHAGLRM